jgi:hypothetical protein
LGHIILAAGIEVDPENIDAIIGWSTQNNMIEVISFMGLASYYRRFIKLYPNIASPITSLIKKGVKFEWTSKCEEIFK